MELENLVKKLESAANVAISWFKNNGMKMNSDKCHLLVSGHKHEIMIANIGGEQVIETHSVKLLGIDIDLKLSFNTHLNTICHKASNKLNALSRLCTLLPFFRRKILMNAFITSQFNYCPLVWMCHSREINNRINTIHYRALHIVYNDNTSSFEDLLRKDGSVTIHQENLRFLAVEMFKVIHGATPSLCLIFLQKNQI